VKKYLQFARVAVAGALLAVVAACGGGGGAKIIPVVFNISITTLADGVLGVDYNQTVTVTGGNGANTFSISAGALPAGLALNAATGAITGTPTAPIRTASFTVTVVDASTPPQSDSQALTIDIVNPLAITSGPLPGTTIGATYNQTVTATGGTTPYTFSVSVGALPAGLTLNTSTGAITGPATATATSQNLTIRVADGSSPQLTATQAQSISVVLEVATTSLPDATAGTAYSQTLQARGGTPPYVGWTRTAGSMPAGISDPVAATGVISGTPDLVCTASTATFTARVSDSAAPPAFDSQAGISITVNPGPVLDITTTAMPNGVVGTAYNVIVQVVGGVPPYAFSTSGTLPSQLGPINGLTGQIAGTPDTVETRNFSVTVTDSCGTMNTQALSITINAVSLGRNDSIATATTLGNGAFAASISPSGNPNTTLAPDIDVYRVTANAGAIVTINVVGPGLSPPTSLDPVLEIVNASNVRFANNCRDPGNDSVSPLIPITQDPTPAAFDDQCINDDIDLGVTRDSMLEFQVPGAGAVTFFVRVLSFDGNARPDLRYEITISGAN
jgi:hypothetical protein